ncbi:hypothetical protein AURDEDRAFT_125087 [Auricularia subglabra TFB-10046 SS5]|nr:hypothetical protein AURDEDRAFT_125087 [Auricularia subglabra TFB-10046 SS5]
MLKKGLAKQHRAQAGRAYRSSSLPMQPPPAWSHWDPYYAEAAKVSGALGLPPGCIIIAAMSEESPSAEDDKPAVQYYYQSYALPLAPTPPRREDDEGLGKDV